MFVELTNKSLLFPTLEKKDHKLDGPWEFQEENPVTSQRKELCASIGCPNGGTGMGENFFFCPEKIQQRRNAEEFRNKPLCWWNFGTKCLKNKQTKSHLIKAKDVIAKQRQTEWEVPHGEGKANEKRRVWVGNWNLTAMMKNCGIFSSKEARDAQFLELL